MSKLNRPLHGKSGTLEHRVWAGMLNRCFCKTSGSYKNYGARGITVCDEWVADFMNFLRDMGEAPPNTQLDRINNNGNYEKSNCRWVSRKENARNTRANRMIEYRGQIKALSAWAEDFKITRAALERRIFKMKWSIHDALTLPVMTKEEVSNLANNKRWNKQTKTKECA